MMRDTHIRKQFVCLLLQGRVRRGKPVRGPDRIRNHDRQNKQQKGETFAPPDADLSVGRQEHDGDGDNDRSNHVRGMEQRGNRKTESCRNLTSAAIRGNPSKKQNAETARLVVVSQKVLSTDAIREDAQPYPPDIDRMRHEPDESKDGACPVAIIAVHRK